MALERLTKISGGALPVPLNLSGDLNVAGVTTSQGIDGIGIHSAGTAIHSGVISRLNFIGAGNTFAVHNDQVDISIAGGGGGGISYDTDTLNKVLFLHSSRFESDTSISFPQGFGEVFGHEDSSIVIEPGVTVDIDDDCLLLMTTKDDFDISFFGNPSQGTNIFRNSLFEDNVRSTFESNVQLKSGVVGYGKLPVEARDDVLYNIVNNVIVDVDDGALLVL